MLIPCKSVSRFTREVKKNQIHDLTLGQFDTLFLDSTHYIGTKEKPSLRACEKKRAVN